MADVELRQVSKTFADGTIGLSNLDLSIAGGTRLAILGPSGSGKSTLLRLIAGLDFPTAGTIRLGGKTVSDAGATASKRVLAPAMRDVGMVFQGENLLAHLTVGENLLLGAKLRGDDLTTSDLRARESAERLKISPLWDRLPHELSGGEAQRAALGRLLTTRPRIWLLDEPAAHVDPSTKQDLMQWILKLHSETHTTLIYVTHDQAEAMAIGDRVAVLNRGQLMQVDSPRKLLQEPASAFVASFVGTPPSSLIEIHCTDGVWRLGEAEVDLSIDRRLVKSGRVVAGIPPHAISFPAVPGAAQLEGTVNSTAWLGAAVRISLTTTNGATLTIDCDTANSPDVGSTQTVGVDLSRCHLFHAEDGQRIH